MICFCDSWRPFKPDLIKNTFTTCVRSWANRFEFALDKQMNQNLLPLLLCFSRTLSHQGFGEEKYWFKFYIKKIILSRFLPLFVARIITIWEVLVIFLGVVSGDMEECGTKVKANSQIFVFSLTFIRQYKTSEEMQDFLTQFLKCLKNIALKFTISKFIFL